MYIMLVRSKAPRKQIRTRKTQSIMEMENDLFKKDNS